jgi:transposase InsO family protein
MSAKEALMWDVNNGMSVTMAAEVHGVKRSCAYKWVDRYRRLGLAGLEELSRAPEHSPNRISQALVAELVELKRKHPRFGPAKLVTMLKERHGEHVMAVSTAGELLAGHGLVRKRRAQRSTGSIEHPPFEVAGAGDSMTTDYKGQFRMDNKVFCYPLTIADPFSRYVFAIDALASTEMAGAMAGFEHVFREFGIPRQMISDNGTPFCSSHALGGLTQLSRRWIELGIIPIRIQRGHPEQNGIHERMHRTFKDWVIDHPRASLRAHQRSFNLFRSEFNNVRPHQSLGQKPPASAVKPYRPFSSRPGPLEYDTTMVVRPVRSKGYIQWNGALIFTSEVLAGANIGLLQIGETVWSIHFGAVRIGYLDGLAQRVLNRLPERLNPQITADDDAG